MAYQLWFIKTARLSNASFVTDTLTPKEKEKLEHKVMQGMYVRSLTTYMQIFTLIYSFGINVSSFLTDLNTTSQVVANPTSSVFYSTLCSLLDLGADPSVLLYYKVGFVVLLPIMKALIITLYRLVYWRFQLSDNRRAVLKITFVCLFLLEQPGVFKELAGFISCIQIDHDSETYYIAQDLGYQCYTDSYNYFLNIAVIPAMIFYGVIGPLFFFFRLCTMRHKLERPWLRMSYGALYNEYGDHAYYWGIVVIVMKLILMYMGSILNNDVITKAFSVFIILFAYYAVYERIKPYGEGKETLFRAEQLALISYLVTIFGSVYILYNSVDFASFIALVMIVVINVITIYVLVKGIIMINLLKIKEALKPLLKRLAAKRKVKKVLEKKKTPNKEVELKEIKEDSETDSPTERNEMRELRAEKKEQIKIKTEEDLKEELEDKKYDMEEYLK